MSYYPAPPAERFAYDTDGSMVTWYMDRSHIAVPQGLVEQFNDEFVGIPANESGYTYVSSSSVQFDGAILSVIFPDARTVTHFFWSMRYNPYLSAATISWGGNVDIEVSTDSTNGQDGTWTVVASNIDKQRTKRGTNPRYRELLVALASPAVGVTGVRAKIKTYYGTASLNAMQPMAFHIWGSTATSGKLSLWKPVADSVLEPSDLDWGDVPPSDTSTKTFRVKNTHASLTAASITIVRSTLTDASPSHLNNFELSGDGTSWTTSISIGDLAPGGISDVVHIRKTTPGNANPSLQAIRVKAAAGSWS